CVNLYIEKGQHAQTRYPNEPVKKTVAILD
ncbi:TPA: hypothetical protein PF716_001476, partial [Staphylococcus aureus]|nr:hypothetical protein [Staphylococcus aureus]HDG6092137.1 hypothetical protein [Staphylococcus aureus]HDG6094765.1 hypothetical protein [Staphylococcus aureus]HDG6100172.1 hypothetical protein [Staphylococcus aureus]HDG6181965.1 hypothetical protein [Staphylococcus aureus]